MFQDILSGAIRWVTREVDADLTPNLASAAPGAMTNPEFTVPQQKLKSKR